MSRRKISKEELKEMALNTNLPTLDELSKMPLMETSQKIEPMFFDGDEVKYLKSLGYITYEEFLNKHKPK